MQPGIIYRLSWNTVPSVTSSTTTIPAQAMVVDILDTETLIDDADTPVVIDLTPTGSPLIIRIINNDRDKFSPIRAKQAVIQFISDKSQFQDVTTFTDSSDNRWSVQITADGNPVFYGFLMLPDSSMAFQPDPNVVQLTASDHLGVLKDLPLVDDDGNSLTNKFKISEIIAFCLKQTGLDLDIVVINNLRTGSGSVSPTETIFTAPVGTNEVRVASTYGSFFYVGQVFTVTGTVSNNTTFHVTGISDDGSTAFVTVSETISSPESSFSATMTDTLSSGHFYDTVYLDAKTFETEINVLDFCYTVLEKILGEDCFLSQWQGKWYIMRVDELDNHAIYPATFDSDGNFVSFDTPTNYNKSIGASEVRRFANADQLLEFDRPNNFIKETYNYTFPSEIVCNINFDRGTFISNLPDETIDNQNFQVKKYSLECWTLARYRTDQTGTLSTGADSYIKKYYQFGYEKMREVVITYFYGDQNPWPYLRSEGIPVGNGDRGTVSVDFKQQVTGFWDDHQPVFAVILVGKSGTNYTWSTTLGTGFWHEDGVPIFVGDATLSTKNFLYTDDSQKGQYNNVSIDFDETPESGTIYIYLASGSTNTTDNIPDTRYYKNLQFTYRPIVNGSYLVYTGNYDKVSRSDTGFIAKREKTVYIQDALRPLFKGAMFFISGLRQLFSGSITFAAPNSIGLSGYHVQDYYIGQKITITGTNAGVFTVVSVTWHIIGSLTEIIVEEAITTVTESATISEYVFELTSRWYSSAPWALGYPPNLTYLHPYSYIQSYSVWNQYKNANRIISGGVLGLGSMWCDAFDKISLTDNNPNTNNRYFMLISFEQNWKTALWSGVFIEDYRTDLGRDTTSSHEFKYTVT